MFNILGNQPVEMLRRAREIYAKRSVGFAKDSPEANCLPSGPTSGLFGMAPVKFTE